MKCEKCNEKEANFFYTATVNGKTTQRHLCTDCARQEGFDQYLDMSPRGMFDDMWSDFSRPFGMLDSFFGGRSLLSPMMTMPSLHFLIDEPQTEVDEEQRPEQVRTAPTEASSKDIPTDAGTDVKKRRELSALKHQLKSALKDENYEAAIVLRDKIKELEG